ncbi:MAG: TetR/AcrR family transcriptional regulator [Aeromicrobium sp.]
MKMNRKYAMTTRADAVEATRRRIMQSTWDLHGEQLFATISLETIADRAGVSVQTVLRQFGSRARLFDAAMEFGAAVVTEERQTPAGDVPGAVRAIVDHYELRGDGVILLLAQENEQDAIRQITQHGRQLHRDWVQDVFAPSLKDLSAKDQESLVDLLVVATDVYTWKLLRRDRGHNRKQTEMLINRLLSAVLGIPERKS